MELSQEEKRKIIGVLTVLFPTATIYLFGSRARGDHRPHSDIDIAIDMGKPIEPRWIGEARDMLAGSDILCTIEIVDFWSIPEEMRQQILKEGIIWKR